MTTLREREAAARLARSYPDGRIDTPTEAESAAEFDVDGFLELPSVEDLEAELHAAVRLPPQLLRGERP